MTDKRKRSAQKNLGVDPYGGQIHDQHVTNPAKSRAIGEPRLSYTICHNKPGMAGPQKFTDVLGPSNGYRIHSRYGSHNVDITNRDDNYYGDDPDYDGCHTEDGSLDGDNDDDDDDDGGSDREVVDGSSTSEGGQGERDKGFPALFDQAEGMGRGNQGIQKATNMENVDGDRGRGRGRGQGWDKSGSQSTSYTATMLCPGGPLDNTLLESYSGHVASSVWAGMERSVLTCHTLHEQLMKWRLPIGLQADELVNRTGLSHLGQCMFKHVNMPLLSAFVERWHPETNSFHMPFGEMTITLHDVFYILKIPIAGMAVTHKQGSEVILNNIADQQRTGCLERKEQSAGGGLSLAAVQEQCSKAGVPAQDVARGYLTHLLAATLFVEKKKDKLPAALFSLLDDLDYASKYAWAAATLAHLYRQLGIASRSDSKQLAGCTTLLETWIYEYFPKFRPSPRVGWRADHLRPLRWITETAPPNNFQFLKMYRRMLDLAKGEEVIWMPFRQNIVEDKFDEGINLSSFHGCIRFFDVIEPYMPDRVLRQFGHVQSIPINPIRPYAVYRQSSRRYFAIYPAMESNWDDPESHVLSLSRLGRRAQPASAVMPNYMEWYLVRTHPQVQNPCQMPEYDRYHIQQDMPAETRLHLIAQYLTPILPERRHQLKDDQAWKYVDQACELIRGLTKEKKNLPKGLGLPPK